MIVVDGEAPRGHDRRWRSRGLNPTSTPPRPPPRSAPDDVLTLIYTSGTTGPPKGVQLSHHASCSRPRSTEEIILLEPGATADLVAARRPTSPSGWRTTTSRSIYAGTITCCPNPREILSYLPQVRPTWFFAVPRIWEKLKAGLEAMQRRPARGAAQADRGRDRGGDRAGAAAPAAASRCPRSSRRRVAAGRRADVLEAARDARPRPGDRGQRRRGADAGRGARVLPRARDRAGRAVGDVRDVRVRHLQPARATSRSAPSGRRRRASR